MSVKEKLLTTVAAPPWPPPLVPSGVVVRKKRPLLTTDQVATIFGVTRNCIERARLDRRGLGLIPYIRLPGTRFIRYDPDVVDAYIAKSEVK